MPPDRARRFEAAMSAAVRPTAVVGTSGGYPVPGPFPLLVMAMVMVWFGGTLPEPPASNRPDSTSVPPTTPPLGSQAIIGGSL
jgi:hypothetical protein